MKRPRFVFAGTSPTSRTASINEAASKRSSFVISMLKKWRVALFKSMPPGAIVIILRTGKHLAMYCKYLYTFLISFFLEQDEAFDLGIFCLEHIAN